MRNKENADRGGIASRKKEEYRYQENGEGCKCQTMVLGLMMGGVIEGYKRPFICPSFVLHFLELCRAAREEVSY